MMPERLDRRAVRGDGREAPAGTAVLIEAFYEDARSLAPDDFEARHGSGFLLVTATGPDGPKGTTTTQLLLDGVDDNPDAHTANLAVVVYPLHRRGIGGGHLVTMGREAKHDVVIPDMSVSRFHAFAKPGQDGAFLILDAGSTNGTTVNGVSVPTRGAGPPTLLKPGDTVRLGQVEFTFTDARALQQFALKAGA